MNTKLIFKMAQTGFYTPESMTEYLIEATHMIKNFPVSSDQVNDLELTCLIMHEYLKNNPGKVALMSAVAGLLKALHERNLASATVGIYDNSFSTTSLISGGEDIVAINKMF